MEGLFFVQTSRCSILISYSPISIPFSRVKTSHPIRTAYRFPPYKDGMPLYTRIKGVAVPEKLSKFDL